METWLEIDGLAIHSPVTAFTNLLLAWQCGHYYRTVRTGSMDRAGCWSLFFLAMAITTLAGVPKHGFGYAMSSDLYSAVLWISCLGSGVAVYFAQHATLVSGRGRSGPWWAPGPRGAIDWVGALPALQGAAYLGTATLMGPEMLLTAANTALGLSPVIVVEAVRLRRGTSGAGAWTLAGLSVSLFTGVVYVGNISMGVWFNHIDLAHVLMGVSFWLMVRGAPESRVYGTDRAPRARRSGRNAVEGFATDLGETA
jgi:hypothetical protein